MNRLRTPTRSGRRARAKRPVRKLAWGANSLVAVLLAALLTLMINYLAFRHFRRVDLSRTQFYTLSDRTRNLLEGLSNTVEAVMLFRSREHPLHEEMERLLKEYRSRSPYLQVSRVDPDRELARAEELRARYGLEEPNVIVLDHNGRVRVIRAEELAEYDTRPVRFGNPPEMTAFKGEQALTTALYDIVQEEPPRVYFLTGHGERDLDRFDRTTGYSTLARILRQNNVEHRTLSLTEAGGVPQDADLVIVAGPERPFTEAERKLLQDYLERKGRLMAMLDAGAETGLEPLLADWGVACERDRVIDPARTLLGRELYVTDYGEHPIVEPMRGLTAVLYMPRSVRPADDAVRTVELTDRPRSTVLIETSASGWAEADPDRQPAQFDPERDRAGPVPLAVAVERGLASDTGMHIAPTRLVVFGDSDFVSNGGLAGGNRDLFLNAMNWLIERERQIAVAPKPVEERRLTLTEGRLRSLLLTLTVGLPGAVALVALAVGWRRRG